MRELELFNLEKAPRPYSTFQYVKGLQESRGGSFGLHVVTGQGEIFLC